MPREGGARGLRRGRRWRQWRRDLSHPSRLRADDSYRLTYQGYDYLALHAVTMRGTLTAFGSRIGVGKEADIYLATNEARVPIVCKFQRLGRTSFRNIRNARAYHQHRSHASWFYLSRLASIKVSQARVQ